jgi:hypothetical protein
VPSVNDSSGGPLQASLKQVTVRGHQIKTVLVQLTDDETLSSQFLYAPLSVAKIVNATDEMPRVDILDIGQATYNSAVSLGRLALLQGLAYKESRFYVIESNLRDGSIPTLGETATLEDGFTGTILGYKFRMDGGAETLEIRILDFTNTLV